MEISEKLTKPREFSRSESQLMVLRFIARTRNFGLFLSTSRDRQELKIDAITTSGTTINRTFNIIGIRISLKVQRTRLKRRPWSNVPLTFRRMRLTADQ